MAEQGALFEQEETFTVGQVTARVHRAVAAAFPAEVWVRGEVDGLRPPNAGGHVYLSLSEKARGRDNATLGVVLLRQSRLRIERTLAAHPGFRLTDGIEVRVRGRVQYGFGRIQLVVSEIDPVHTLGRLAAARDRALAALAAEGLVGRNAAIPLPLAPLHLAVVTSDGSAACHDVLHELESSGIGFRVRLVDARVQGHGAEASLLAGLTRAVASRPDLVLLVRGGGSRTDLATFDSERLARLIAGAPVPVLTGIGHEIDSSVADLVAHGAHKTPTACAAAVVEQVRAAAARSEVAWGTLAARAAAAGQAAERALEGHAVSLASVAGAAVADAQQRLDLRAGRVTGTASHGLAAGEARVQERARRLERAATRDLDLAAVRLGDAVRGLDPGRLGRQLDRRSAELGAAARRLVQAGGAVTASRAGALDVLAARAAAVDPARALARGWSITRTAGGTLVRSVADADPGTSLRTTVGDGTVASTVDPELGAAHPPEEQP
ncbi:MAG: Exodeoxyribonuclease VII large subunit [uncultured Acidimicrobiales bacterium]|uniref:Exodeoxyribonuclease 7 large subunit n=1 Tax=uncultured Acidimicrobiales bacterium TaxID=310071 RepID=A0A6J4IB29_9ACTN|nr:MAG: Exodeoxyribonuclease VII large subunit [uncultured Acidimicrobiales bacterium]